MAHRWLARRYASEIKRTELDRPWLWSGRGVVIAGGGAKYIPSLWVNVNVLRRRGCNLPVQIWHLGEAELDPAVRGLFAGLDVEWVDALEVARIHQTRILNGWELKPYSILHSRFAEVLFIDADNFAVQDPSFVFDLPAYLQHGSLWWPDFPHWSLPPKRPPESWAAFGLQVPANLPAKDEGPSMWGQSIPADMEVSLETGQSVIDKRRCWRELALANWYCQHSDFTFNFYLGDTGAFHFAWLKCGTPFGRVNYWPAWETHTILQHDPSGQVLFHHRTALNNKLRLGNNPRAPELKEEPEYFALVNHLAQRWSGMLWYNTAPSEAESTLGRELAGTRWRYRRVDLDERELQLVPGGVVGDGAAKHEVWWSPWVVDGEERLAVGSPSGPTFLARRATDGCGWRGRWFVGEKAEVELVPVARDTLVPAEA